MCQQRAWDISPHLDPERVRSQKWEAANACQPQSSPSKEKLNDDNCSSIGIPRIEIRRLLCFLSTVTEHGPAFFLLNPYTTGDSLDFVLLDFFQRRGFEGTDSPSRQEMADGEPGLGTPMASLALPRMEKLYDSAGQSVGPNPQTIWGGC